MSLYTQWTEMVVDYVKTKGENAFWAEYSKLEKGIYKDLLANHKEVTKTTINELAKKYNSTVEFAMGFMDGINDSLKNQYDLETIDADTELVFDLNLETLIFSPLLCSKPVFRAALSPFRSSVNRITGYCDTISLVVSVEFPSTMMTSNFFLM